MAHFLFMDESGHDLVESPYEVLAGVCIEDRTLWELVCRLHDAELMYFGRRISSGALELKGKKLLKRKTFRLASQMPPFSPAERTELASHCLERTQGSGDDPSSSGVSRRELTALAQAKLAFVRHILETAKAFRLRVFASIVDRDAPRPGGDFLRKDYSYLFQRFFYFLEDLSPTSLGLIVFDELERSQCHILLNQMTHYFRRTATGRDRASRIVPEPFFVHSELTSAIQIADIVAYTIAWGLRLKRMIRPARAELGEIARQVLQLQYETLRQPYRFTSIIAIDDLRPLDARRLDDAPR